MSPEHKTWPQVTDGAGVGQDGDTCQISGFSNYQQKLLADPTHAHCITNLNITVKLVYFGSI